MIKKIIFFTIVLILTACSPTGIQILPVGISAPNSAYNQASPTSASTIVGTMSPTASMTSTPLPSATPAVILNQVPNFDHIVLMVLENEDYQKIVDSPEMPLLNALANKYVLLTNYFAIRHPSLPNYISLVSGDTQGISSDCRDCFVDQPNLADLIEKSGKTWKAYQEDMPSACFLGDADPYAQKHNPFIYFNSIRLDPSRCQRSIVPLTQLDKDLAANNLPNFSFIMPNLCNSAHDCPFGTADKWVADMVNKLQASPSFGNNTLIIVTFDEGDKDSKGSCCGMGKEAGGQVFTTLISPLAKAGFSDSTPYSHFSLLKTILQAWNLPGLGKTTDTATQPILLPWK
jgi:phosphatidylinositol-3-phosphatase